MATASTIGSSQFADLAAALQKLGADVPRLAAAAGMPQWPADDSEERISTTPILRLFDLAAQALDDPLLGLHAGALSETRGPLFYLLLSTRPVSQGLRLFARFASLPLDAQSIKVEISDGLVELRMEFSDPAIVGNHHAVDYIVGENLQSLRRAIPGFQLTSSTLMHPEIGPAGETAHVLGCPVEFNADHNVLRFSESILQATPAAPNPAIAEQIEKFSTLLIDRIAPSSFRDRTIDTIRMLLAAGSSSNRSAASKRLHVSERTLQRKLELESATFSELHDLVRAEVSRALLQNRDLKVESVARSVGFAEVASFSKAFARWTGSSPTAYRRSVQKKTLE